MLAVHTSPAICMQGHVCLYKIVTANQQHATALNVSVCSQWCLLCVLDTLLFTPARLCFDSKPRQILIAQE